jgi:two-component system, LytTR family, sensor kinase
VQTQRRIGLWLLVSVPLTLAALGTVSFLAQWHFTGQPRRVHQLVVSQGAWVVCAALAPGVFAASRRWPLSGTDVGRHIALHMALASVYWIAAGSIFQGILPALVDPPPASAGGFSSIVWADVAARVGRWFVTTLPFGAIIYFSIVGLEHAIRYFAEARERDLQMAQLETSLARARLAALQGQVNPHFLFNTLNTIAVRAREGDGAGTARIAEQLAEILRRTLSREESHEVPLSEELDVVRQYLGIEKARFADRLQATFDVDDDALGGAVPTLAVQHLVENAVRHGIARSPDGGRVTIAARRDGDTLEVGVIDDGSGVGPRPDAQDQQAGGIGNTRERLRSLYGAAASLDITENRPRGTIATLRVPYREVALDLSDAQG